MPLITCCMPTYYLLRRTTFLYSDGHLILSLGKVESKDYKYAAKNIYRLQYSLQFCWQYGGRARAYYYAVFAAVDCQTLYQRFALLVTDDRCETFMISLHYNRERCAADPLHKAIGMVNMHLPVMWCQQTALQAHLFLERILFYWLVEIELYRIVVLTPWLESCYIGHNSAMLSPWNDS